MHFVHKSSDGRLAVVVVLFQLGKENDALDYLLPKMPKNRSREQLIPTFSVDPLQFLPREHGYYTYDGSLTAPPCTEGITWLVLKQPVEISTAQLNQLKSFFPSNARPVQALHARTIKESM